MRQRASSVAAVSAATPASRQIAAISWLFFWRIQRRRLRCTSAGTPPRSMTPERMPMWLRSSDQRGAIVRRLSTASSTVSQTS